MSYRFGMDLSVLLSEEDMSLPAAIYRPRHPQDSDYYHCVEDYIDEPVKSYHRVIPAAGIQKSLILLDINLHRNYKREYGGHS